MLNADRIPLSIALFIFTGVIYGLQQIPILGVFLMMLAAPFWSVLTINVGFAVMIHDCASKKLPKVLLLVPAVWFGGYLTLAYHSHLQADEVRSRIESFNNGKAFSFDTARQDLQIAEDLRHVVSARSIIEDYAVSSVFMEEPSGKCGPIQSLSLRTKHCAKRGRNVGETAPGCPIVTNYIFREEAGNRKASDDICIAYERRRPTKPVVRVSLVKTETVSTAVLYSRIRTISISGPDNKQTLVQVGTAQPLTWLPMPMMGCVLVSSNPSWNCDIGFNKSDIRYIGYSAVTAALGLQHSPAEQRLPTTGE